MSASIAQVTSEPYPCTHRCTCTWQNCVIDGYHIEEGQAIVYLSHSAHRDPDVFKDPEKFDPGRWTRG